MPTPFNPTVVQRTTILMILSVAIAWFIAVPGLLTLSNFVVLMAFLAAFAWVANTTYMNAQPADNLAQALKKADVAATIERATKIR